jgi:hypothetical protein
MTLISLTRLGSFTALIESSCKTIVLLGVFCVWCRVQTESERKQQILKSGVIMDGVLVLSSPESLVVKCLWVVTTCC